MVDSFIATSEQSKMVREESVWRLCSALFTHSSHLNGELNLGHVLFMHTLSYKMYRGF